MTRRRLAILPVVGVLAAGVVVGLATAATPSKPTITAKPADPTNAVGASFSFTGASSYQCSLDNAAYAACSSPKTYAGPLASGDHTFRVRSVSRNQTSAAQSYSWQVDRTAPRIISIDRDDRNPTNDSRVGWELRFSEAVSGVDASDFVLVESGLGGAPAITGISGSGARYLVTAGTGTGDGTLRLNLVDNDSIKDAATNPLGGAGAGNGSATGAIYDLDRTGPTVVPTIVHGPRGTVSSRNATFLFVAEGRRVAGYRCQLDGGAWRSCFLAESYGRLGEGSHSFAVAAVDDLGNRGPSATRTWVTDTIAPPRPTITSKPSDPTTSTTASFSFTGEAGASFECRLDHGAWSSCVSPKAYAVAVGASKHTFRVRASDGAGNASPTADWSWKVESASGSGVPFTISGGSNAFLHPGLWRPLALTLANPNNSVVYVTSLTVTAADAPGCPVNPNLEVQQADVDATAAKRIAVPANGSTTIPAARQPQIRLKNVPNVNQDACKGKTFALSYAGEATQ